MGVFNRPKTVKHGMVFNHAFHSALWFWNRGMKRRAVAQWIFSVASYHLVTKKVIRKFINN